MNKKNKIDFAKKKNKTSFLYQNEYSSQQPCDTTTLLSTNPVSVQKKKH
jgi:hypothetical protein